VHVATGGIDLRFPGQWFQAESGLHQNWMRDYDPTTGRYLQADPLGLVDGASVYGYALQNPGRYTDPTGEYTLQDAIDSLYSQAPPRNGTYYTDRQILDEWLRLERLNQDWLKELKPCPCSMYDGDPGDWTPPEKASQRYHPGGTWATRSKNATPGRHGNQCVFDASGNLISSAPAAGSADYYAPVGASGIYSHVMHDVNPYKAAERADRISEYFSVRPVVSEPCCE
jgi:RHS repeat-associated protein